jgi:hypothetical protein
MRLLLFFIFLLVAGTFLAYPLLMQQTPTECGAFEERVMELASHDKSGTLTIGQLYGSSSSEPSGAAYAQDHYPLLPSEAGCALAYWKSVLNPEATPATKTAAAPPPAASATEPSSAVEPADHASNQPVSVIARDMTLNGDPISPGTIFTMPMNTVAIRVDYTSREAGLLRFHLMQGRALLATRAAQKIAAGTVWCKFGVQLKKGNYTVSFTANNTVLGEFTFAVIGG